MEVLKICPNCHSRTIPLFKVIHGHHACSNCDALVGVHSGYNLLHWFFYGFGILIAMILSQIAGRNPLYLLGAAISVIFVGACLYVALCQLEIKETK